MAKLAKAPVAPVKEVIQEIENDTAEQTTPAVVQDIVEEAVVMTKEVEEPTIVSRGVRIKCSRDYSTFIGTTRYHFQKGKIESVPENVKRILNKVPGLLLPL